MLTKEQIMEMEAGPEMDNLVALHVMGWKLSNSDFWNWTKPDGENVGDAVHGGWEPSTDIATALEVWDKIGVHGSALVNNDMGKWALAHDGFQNLPENGDTWDYAGSFVIPKGYWCDTREMAICRAALLGVVET